MIPRICSSPNNCQSPAPTTTPHRSSLRSRRVPSNGQNYIDPIENPSSPSHLLSITTPTKRKINSSSQHCLQPSASASRPHSYGSNGDPSSPNKQCTMDRLNVQQMGPTNDNAMGVRKTFCEGDAPNNG